MDINIRDVDAAAIKKIDDIAKGKGLSRSKFLRQQLQLMAVSSELKETEDRYSALVDNIVSVLENQQKQLDEILKAVQVPNLAPYNEKDENDE